MPPEMIAPLTAFFLTSLIGGTFAAFLQHRSWRRQWFVARTQQRIADRTGIFSLVSTLMDKRLYRLHQLRVWTEKQNQDRYQEALNNYREIMAKWNDNINRLLSLLQVHFGKSERDIFDYEIGEKFVTIGRDLESLSPEHQDVENINKIKDRIKSLRSQVYVYNLHLLSKIEALQSQLEPPGFFKGFRKPDEIGPEVQRRRQPTPSVSSAQRPERL